MVFLNIDEVKKIAAAGTNTDMELEIKKAFLFACYTGLRISDLENLAWKDIEHNPLQIIKRQTKTSAKVVIPIKDSVWAFINDGSIHNHEALVFPLLCLIKQSRNYYLLQWMKRVKLDKNIGWHTARHTFAILSLENGADLYTVSKLLGHKDLKTTQVYAKIIDKMKRMAVNGLPAIEMTNDPDKVVTS
ncbi:Tyrosine recombinase XerD [termite gut metagenome]|uniref:Tyrosine recombinase XerD n=1 Tax=termite gut metagenome TaxID=433724 RepID=A0A5J4RT65_9ZZZZ